MAVRMCLLAVDCQARSHVVFHFLNFLCVCYGSADGFKSNFKWEALDSSRRKKVGSLDSTTAPP